MTTLADKAILSGADNHPQMLEKDIPKKYSELSATEAIQDDCDVKATNIILQGLPPKLRNSSNPRQQATVNNGRVTVQPIHGRHTSLAAGTSRTYTSRASGNNFEKQRTVICYNCKGEGHMSKQCTKPKRKGDESWFKDKKLKPHRWSSPTMLLIKPMIWMHMTLIVMKSTLPKLHSWGDLSHYGSDDLAEVHNHDNVNHNLINQAVQAMLLSEQSNIMNQSETKITSDSNVIPYSQYKTNAIVIRDPEETLMLAEESRSKMLLKQKDLMMSEKKVNTKPVDYNSVNSEEPNPSTRPTQVEVPKELPKVSMVNKSLKKLKHHLASFDVVVKERITATAITEGTWGFEHTKSCFRDEIIPFVKALKYLFNSFDQFFIDELSEVQNVFHQMEQAVEQHRVESKTFQVKMNKVLNENERFLEQVISKDIVNIVVTSIVNNAHEPVHECERCVKLKTELQKDFIKKELYDKLFKRYTTLEKHCISLEVDT
nr:hypothetical protein [Tanacetum cinerariifolium]